MEKSKELMMHILEKLRIIIGPLGKAECPFVFLFSPILLHQSTIANYLLSSTRLQTLEWQRPCLYVSQLILSTLAENLAHNCLVFIYLL